MVIISFANGTDWYKANWVFRQLAKDVAEMYPDDSELNFEMEKGGAFGHLALDCMETNLRARIVSALKAVATLLG